MIGKKRSLLGVPLGLSLSNSSLHLHSDGKKKRRKASTSSARTVLATLIAILLPFPAFAQASQCRVPDRITLPEREDPPAGEVRNARATQHLLALSWSPHYCRTRGNDPQDRLQCGGEVGKFGFILHGLWPDVAGKSDPAWCAPAKPLSRSLIEKHFCMTPSPRLLNHEWAKHGTCASSDPDKYFKAAGLLYAALKFPDMDSLSRRRITVATLSAAFAGQNPGVRPNMVAVHTDKGGWLKEVRLCLDASMRPKVCAPEDRGTKPTRFLKIWRGRS